VPFTPYQPASVRITVVGEFIFEQEIQVLYYIALWNLYCYGLYLYAYVAFVCLFVCVFALRPINTYRSLGPTRDVHAF
jgi:hypothetical protein